MRHLRLLFALLMISTSLACWAQSSTLIVYTEEREDFTLWINGFKINNQPGQHLRITGMNAGEFLIQAIFTNPNLPQQKISLNIQAEREITYGLVRRSSAAPLEFRFLNESTTGYFPVAPPRLEIVPYLGPMNTVNPAQPVPMPAPVPVPAPAPVVIVPAPVRPNPLPGYNGQIGCEYPMDPIQFADAKQRIAAKSFSDTKMQLSQQITRSNCLLVSQVAELMALFSFESQKLEFAKFAYAYTYDQGNYYKVNDAFGFESSIRELEQFLSGK